MSIYTLIDGTSLRLSLGATSFLPRLPGSRGTELRPQ